MVRTKNLSNKRRARQRPESSSAAQAQEPPAQRRRGDKPTWGGGPLSGMDPDWQLELFKEKMGSLSVKHTGFICEKVVNRSHFGPFGIVKYFQDLGWDAVMGFDEMSVDRVYSDLIEEWVGTLRMEGNDRTLKLVGIVNGVEVVMSKETLNHVARFDTKQSAQYIFPAVEDLYTHPDRHPTWQRMVNTIFEPGKGSVMRRNDLRIEAKLLLVFLNNNVMPRRGDKTNVRHFEVPVLYALMNGSPKISFRYLAMLNIWEARENKEKKIIPHCKLIQALLRWNGVIGDDDVYTKKHHTSFKLEKLSTQAWQYYYNDRVHRLIDRATGRIWDAEKEGARPLQPGENDEFRSATGAQNVGGNVVVDEEEDDQPIGQLIVRSHRGESSSRGNHVHDARDTTHGVNDEGLERIVQIARPDAWRDWPPYAQATFDQGTRNAELQRREIQRMYDRSEHWNRLHAYNFQREINHSFDDDQQRRMHAAWHAGEPVVQHPPVIDYTAIGPYDGSVRYPQPQAHHSEWIDPYQDAAHRAGQDASSSSAYNFGELRETMESIFGPPQSRYY